MTIREMLYNTLMSFFVIATCITAGMLVLGCVYENDAVITYKAFASPLLFAALCVIPNFVTYSKKELSDKQIIIRKVLQFIFIESEVLTVAFASPNIPTENTSFVIGLIAAVAIIYVIVNFIMFTNNILAAKKLANELKIFQKNMNIK